MQNPTSAVVAALALSAATGSVYADQALATAKNCMACHSMDTKQSGLSFKEIAAKYAGRKDGDRELAVKVVKGGHSAWGPIPVQTSKPLPPGQAKLAGDVQADSAPTPAEAKRLAMWIMQHK